MEKIVITDAIKQNNIRNLEYASKEMKKLAKKMQKQNGTDEESQNTLAGMTVEASFMLNCFGVSSAAFASAFNDLKEGALKGDVLYYLKEEFTRFIEAHGTKQEETIEEGEEENVKTESKE